MTPTELGSPSTHRWPQPGPPVGAPIAFSMSLMTAGGSWRSRPSGTGRMPTGANPPVMASALGYLTLCRYRHNVWVSTTSMVRRRGRTSTSTQSSMSLHGTSWAGCSSRMSGRPWRHQEPLPPAHAERQSVLRIAVQDDEVPVGLPQVTPVNSTFLHGVSSTRPTTMTVLSCTFAQSALAAYWPVGLGSSNTHSSLSVL